MITKFNNKTITSILTVLPTNEIDFLDEMENYGYSEVKMKKLKKIMGYNTRRVAKAGETVSDYAIFGIQNLIDNGALRTDEIGAIIVTTTSPDHFIPPISNLVQGHFSIGHDCVCIDISQGCCGYTVGLAYAMMTLEHLGDKKALVISGDMMTAKVGTRDRAARPILGDAVTISVVENKQCTEPVYCNLMNEGEDAQAIIIPAGGSRLPISPETSVEVQDEDGNWRSAEHFFMEGDLVFNFVINETPKLINDLLDYSGINKESIDYFVCHQPNKFMLRKLAEKLEVSDAIMPNDIVELYGNSNSATIPVTFCQHYSEIYSKKDVVRLCFAAFGSGLALGSLFLELPKLSYCNIINYPHKNA